MICKGRKPLHGRIDGTEIGGIILKIAFNMFTKRNAVLLSPFFIISINLIVAIISNRMIGKWSFVPIILIEWVLFMFFVLWFGGTDSIKNGLKNPPAVSVGRCSHWRSELFLFRFS